MIHNTLKVIFFGSSEYCLPVLEAINRNFQLVGIITKVKQTTEQFAKSHNIRYFTPHNQNELLNLKTEIEKLKPDLAIVADYGLIIPKEIFSLPRHKTLNIHFSRLPDLRGASPVQYTILRGDKSAWISVIIMDEGIDTGDIIKITNYKLQITNETTEILYKKLFSEIALELPQIVTDYLNGKLTPQKQDHAKATCTKLFKREDGFIPLELLGRSMNEEELSGDETLKYFSKNSVFHQLLLNGQMAKWLIEKATRALTPWPGLWTEIPISPSTIQPLNHSKTKRLKILHAHLETEPRTKNFELRTKLVIDTVQLEGKKPVSWKQFLEGHPTFWKQLL